MSFYLLFLRYFFPFPPQLLLCARSATILCFEHIPSSSYTLQLPQVCVYTTATLHPKIPCLSALCIPYLHGIVPCLTCASGIALSQSCSYEYYKLVKYLPLHESSLIYVVRKQGTPDQFGRRSWDRTELLI